MPSPSRSNFLISPQPNIPQTKMGRTLLVLLWKHLTVRRRQYISTPAEFLLPTLFFIIMFFTRGLFIDFSTPDVDLNSSQIVQYSAPIHVERLTKPDVVVYYPQNNNTDQLMKMVGKSLQLKPMPFYDGDRRGYFGIKDETTITEYLKNFKQYTHAFVKFQNMDGGLPMNLNYTIRIKTDFLTHIYEALDDDIGPHKMFGMEYEEFVRLQWSIDTAYLELLTGSQVAQNVSIQEFPYVRSKGASSISVVVLMLNVGVYLSLAITFVFVMIRLIEERASGIQELIKMVGVTTQTLGLSHCINFLPGAVVFSVVGASLLVGSATPLLGHSNWLLVWLFLFLHFISIVALSFAASYITDNTQHINGLAVFLYIVALLPSNQLSNRKVPAGLIPITGFLPGVPAAWFYTELSVLEQFGTGLTFSTMLSSHSGQSLSMAMVYIFLLVQISLYFMIAWYLSLVRPGKYGTALPWDFLFRRDYWTKNEVHPDYAVDESQEREKISGEPRYFEPLPANSEVGIEIDNVSKTFANVRALSNITLPVLKGEITVLLGHNGAGKTTLMSIVTGMMTASQGGVYVNGLDTVTQQQAVRSQLGFCPQHNLFFKDLTVLEHVQFFGLLKGTMPWNRCTKAALDLLDQLGLEQKAHCLSGQLSGGMKRRLQLACALAGDANVLVLDEPTAGLDVETRRSLWDLLLSLRSGRTVLLSTHFMEEADALGDRVAALQRGVLRCHATPMHLKKEIDTGYRLSITLKPNTSQSAAALDVSSVIASLLPQATQLAECGVRTLAFNLPSRESDKFPGLFKKLEEKRDGLGIESIGVGVSTLEEVFLKLCNDAAPVEEEDEVDATLQDDIVTRRLSGVKLMLSQISALLVRQMRYSRSSWKMFLLTQIILPIVMLFLVTRLVNDVDYQTRDRNSPLALNLDVYKDMDDRRVLYRGDVPKGKSTSGLQYINTDNISQTLVKACEDDKFIYNKYLFGIELNDTNAVVHYTTTVRHALPVAVNTLSNAIASILSVGTVSITTVNHPINGDVSKENMKLKEPKSQTLTIMWAVCVAFLIQTTLLQVLVLPCKERISRTRHIHIMSGCGPELHWVTSLLYHVTISCLVLVLPSVLFAATLDKNHTINQPDVMFPLVLVLFSGCLAFIAMSFLTSFMMANKAAATALFGFVFLFSIITPSMKTACVMDTSGSCDYYSPILTLLSYTMTPQTFVEAMARLGSVARLNAYCELNSDRCPHLYVNDNGFDTERCCVLKQHPRPYFAFDDYSPLSYMVALFVQFIVIMLLVFLLERGILQRLRDRCLTLKYVSEEVPKDDILLKEKEYVDEAIARPRGDALLISSVHKRYQSLACGRGVSAVRGVSFAVHEGECFGLVGVNGAGKSTTFKMMTCETFPTRGRIVANDQPQRVFDNSKYLNGLGYCPQFFGMDEFLTGRQNLELLLKLDGLSAEDASKEAVRWLELIDLMKYADRPMSSYSGGCARRLSSVGALARRAALSLLDEPTAGVDVAARRQLWRAVRAARAQRTRAGRKRAVLITSHSMDEMEALCSRVGIMSAGTLAALGSPAALRASHHTGLVVFIKIRDTSAAPREGTDVTDSPNLDLKRLKETCLRYQWIPKDEHKTMLNYHVDKGLRLQYSELFTKLEELRTTYPALVEDYAVTETTLEEVFLSYAKEKENV
ncbi:ATP-binding cassette sub-family A member 2 [Amyelois transitella]|uniref:ATP-binding cassette sub-family A member 2 n=1 Tax=Amyelois transitella TaxID=680683 RepID=UPI0029904642|nr:ATP-binding cassette sub-family A member 2 [Amyelois transitella]